MRAVEASQDLALRTNEDVVLIRQAVRSAAVASGFNLVDQTKIVTAASELARNTLIHGGGGQARIETLRDSARMGVRLTFEDRGPGIADISLAMRDGYTSGSGLGLGLGGPLENGAACRLAERSSSSKRLRRAAFSSRSR